jgi:hypothetical protein
VLFRSELSGVSLRCATTNAGGLAYAILNESGTNCRVTLKGMLVKAADVSGPASYEGNCAATNLVGGVTTNLSVTAPGLVTRILCFTNGVLMRVR